MGASQVWRKLLCPERRRPSSASKAKIRSKSFVRTEGRTEGERDYDRIIFCNATRRLSDKTQLFPLDNNDGVHTRLTHSQEVSTLARGIGSDLAWRFRSELRLPAAEDVRRDIPAILAAIGLAHDIGNPPFGHQGEAAICSWFQKNHVEVFKHSGVSDALQQDFLQFNGNAQTFRTLARLQNDACYGLNLTYATLGTLIKYAVPASEADGDSPFSAMRKPGYFASEREIAEDVWAHTGLKKGRRHPLAFLVEACDDAAYGVVDVEDTVKKDLASYPDVRDFLLTRRGRGPKGKVIEDLIEETDSFRRRTVSNAAPHLSPTETEVVSMEWFRVGAMSVMMRGALDVFVRNYDSIRRGSFKGDLIQASEASRLRQLLKDFLKPVALSHKSVLAIELTGSLVIHELMDRMWSAIASQDGDRIGPRDAYTYSRISENYRRAFTMADNSLPLRYREAQLLTDMVSGMTDSYALTLLNELQGLDDIPAI